MECPTCGTELRTEQGMRQHHTKVHGEPLPNRTCSGCGTEFYDQKARLEYCEDCNPNAGAHNGNWRDAKESTVCEACGDEFDYYPSDKEGVYCPECVENSAGLLPDNPSEDIEPTFGECLNCDAEVRVPPSRLRNNERGVFCAQSCHNEWMSKHVVGEAHHQWKPGEVRYWGRWWTVRRNALRRDQYRCQNCGKTEGDMDRTPDVHHIEPVRRFENSQDAHYLENVITLCRTCHRNVEVGNIPAPEP